MHNTVLERAKSFLNVKIINLEIGSVSPPTVLRSAPEPQFHPLFLIFQIPPSIKIYSPPLKKRGAGGGGVFQICYLQLQPEK